MSVNSGNVRLKTIPRAARPCCASCLAKSASSQSVLPPPFAPPRKISSTGLLIAIICGVFGVQTV